MDEDEEDDVLSMKSGGKDNNVIACFDVFDESSFKWLLLTMLSR